MLQIINNDIWKFWENDATIVVPTNGFVKNDGSCVMGRGLAKQAIQRVYNMQFILGSMIKAHGNVPFYFDHVNIITFPVKHNWWEKADLELIKKSACKLRAEIETEWTDVPIPIYMPKVGCGNGQLDWKDVEPIIETLLKDIVLIVDNGKGSSE